MIRTIAESDDRIYKQSIPRDVVATRDRKSSTTSESHRGAVNALTLT